MNAETGQSTVETGKLTPRMEMEAANNFIKEKRFADALEIYDNILKRNPEAVGAYVGKGRVFFHQGDYDEAENYLNGALHLKEDFAPAKSMLARICERRGNLQLALEQNEELLKLRPNLNNSRIAMARAYIKLKRYSDAEKVLREALRYNPQFTQATYMLANTLQCQGDTDKAIETLNELLEKDSSLWRAHLFQARLFFKKEDYSAAIAAAQKSAKLGADEHIIHKFLGRAYCATGQYEEGIVAFKAALSLKPDLFAIKMQLARAYEQIEKYAEAVEILKVLTLGNTRLGLVHLRLASLLAKQEKFSQAVTEYEAVLLHTSELIEKHPEIANIKSKRVSSRDLVTAYSEAFKKIRLSDQAETENEDEPQFDVADIDIDDRDRGNDLA
jgi:tetratricopeptide (TPR) repeat protein